MPVPNIAGAKKLKKLSKATIACVKCKAPLWSIDLESIERYGSKTAADITPFPGVEPYSEYWEKDQKTAKRTDCPFCGKGYFDVIKAGDHLFPRPFVLEWDG